MNMADSLKDSAHATHLCNDSRKSARNCMEQDKTEMMSNSLKTSPVVRLISLDDNDDMMRD